ncbi:hypothetical protein [Picrophilus oshimae]|uniref:Uncharacterized protein n=1 Tax=Picrophilus torridus (strain ATCC 700027 / DSM 9790 / JCM 10055 / NBRC 100828 / KAW 2/3) TaxID=1122961 RepID=A0A8G2L7Y5_PICTO|nr:hypothetical protein [Picrophilus oshimae]SMD30794.1 hypothetical protein SAMN02745355_0705 [Picrophilus oshimae DSM 9789]
MYASNFIVVQFQYNFGTFYENLGNTEFLNFGTNYGTVFCTAIQKIEKFIGNNGFSLGDIS